MSTRIANTPGAATTSTSSWASFVSPKNSASAVVEPNKKSSGTNVSDIEKLVGFVSEQYECVYNNFAGTLYTGPLAVVWLGRIFFFEWTVVIKWEDVAQVQKRSDGVRFKVRSPKAGSYDFSRLFNAEKAWSNLVSLHNDTILDKPRRAPTPRQVTRSLRRMNSDPLRMSMVFEFDGEPSGLGEDTPFIKEASESLLRKKREEALLSRSASVPMGKNKDMEILEESIGQESIEAAASTAVSQKKLSLEHQWSSVVEESTSYAETAVEKHELPCSLESFFDLFVADDCKYSVPKFMEESGDERIQCSPWADDENGESKTRTIEYYHPINAPMAPPMAGARKEQSYRKFGKNGMVMETRTYVSDVPMTDCFFVRDQIMVEPIDDNLVSVTMSFDLEFVKSTMFRAIIVRTTKGEFESFMQRLASYMSKSLGQAASVSTAPPAPAAPITETPNPMSEIFSKSTVALLALVLLLQIWIIVDIRSMKVTLNQLQSLSSTECIPAQAPGLLG